MKTNSNIVSFLNNINYLYYRHRDIRLIRQFAKKKKNEKLIAIHKDRF